MGEGVAVEPMSGGKGQHIVCETDWWNLEACWESLPVDGLLGEYSEC